MQIEQLSEVSYLFPSSLDLESLLVQKPLMPFSDLTMDFLDVFSILLKKEAKEFEDLLAFSFFIRRSNIKKKFSNYLDLEQNKLGRGLVFHITPSNVPINFAYSLVMGLLSGNTNIVRIPSKDYPQILKFCEVLFKIKETNKYAEVLNRIVLLRYDKGNNATKLFSWLCDVRIIWGGDETINSIRLNPLSPKSYDVVFVDKYSIALINADKFILEANHWQLANSFYYDTYFFDQNACTSPNMVIWLGNERNIKKSKDIFWSELLAIVKRKYPPIQPILAMDKLVNFCNMVSMNRNFKLTKVEHNCLWRIQCLNIPSEPDKHKCPAGFFLEYDCCSLDFLVPLVTKKFQTLAYWGFSKKELLDFVLNNNLEGIDRIVPIGRTSDFSSIWDGYDLIYSLTRTINAV